MPPILLQVEDLTLVSNHGPIVQNLSFDVVPGEIVALTGKSGSGKTSIALAILNLLPSGVALTTGQISWFGLSEQKLTLPEDSGKWAPLRGTSIGYIQQDIFGAFDPILRLGDQMMMIARERIPEAGKDLENQLILKMEEVGLQDISRLWNSYPHQLSGGQLQRCQIALAVVIQPALLISDEPTSAIDKINQNELLDVFSMLRSKYNTAILCITHEEDVVLHLADREIHLNEKAMSISIPESSGMPANNGEWEEILSVKALMFTHAYGGMKTQIGASIGELDFAIGRGACLGIVGESGSGKSTIAQLLVGLYTPTHGSVILHGRVIQFRKEADIRYLRSKIQLVMQDGRGSLHPDIPVGVLLEEVVTLKKKGNPEFEVDPLQILKEVGLPKEVMVKKSPQLSGGECLRVSIARALLMKPDILICDESTSSLDGPTRDSMIELLKQLMRDRGMALILISHDERLIRSLSNYILVLAEGKVVEKGPATDIIKFPTHSITKKIFSTLVARQEKK